MKKVLILANHSTIISNFRQELIDELINLEHTVIVATPFDNKISKLTELGCEIIETKMKRRKISIISDLRLIIKYIRIIKKQKPDFVFTYTIKPNIYGGLAARFLKVKFYPNISGLGSALENQSFVQRILISLYRIALKKANVIFFQNIENQLFFENNKIGITSNYKLLPGSGVNLDRFSLLAYPNSSVLVFSYISRIMKEKGIDIFLLAAKKIKTIYNEEVEFNICGYCEEEYIHILDKYQKENIVKYLGVVDDIRNIIGQSHCIVQPSFYPEGMSNVLLESSASGRPIITTNRSGCKEVIDDGLNGYIVKQNDVDDLVKKLKAFILLDQKDRIIMGHYGRKKVETEFDRKIVVDAYINLLSN